MNETSTSLTGDDADIAALYANSLTLLRAVRGILSDLLDDFTNEEPKSVKSLIDGQKELAAALRMAMETERKFDEWKAKHSKDGGVSGGYINVGSARREIGCRLDRLRACCGSE